MEKNALKKKKKKKKKKNGLDIELSWNMAVPLRFSVLDIISKGGVKGIAHITDGGFMKSIPRVFTNGLGATIYKDAWEVPAVFKLIQEEGRIEDAEMRRTFNMGIGMVLVVSPDAAARILGEQHGGYSAYCIGEVTSGEGVTYA